MNIVYLKEGKYNKGERERERGRERERERTIGRKHEVDTLLLKHYLSI